MMRGWTRSPPYCNRCCKYNVGRTSDLGLGIWSFNWCFWAIGRRRCTFFKAFSRTWTGDKYKGVDSGTGRPNEKQASQIVLIKRRDSWNNNIVKVRGFSTWISGFLLIISILYENFYLFFTCNRVGFLWWKT
jgi:hypothetical protein